jgi:hypothetical protein
MVSTLALVFLFCWTSAVGATTASSHVLWNVIDNEVDQQVEEIFRRLQHRRPRIGQQESGGDDPLVYQQVEDVFRRLQVTGQSPYQTLGQPSSSNGESFLDSHLKNTVRSDGATTKYGKKGARDSTSYNSYASSFSGGNTIAIPQTYGNGPNGSGVTQSKTQSGTYAHQDETYDSSLYNYHGSKKGSKSAKSGASSEKRYRKGKRRRGELLVVSNLRTHPWICFHSNINSFIYLCFSIMQTTQRMSTN